MSGTELPVSTGEFRTALRPRRRHLAALVLALGATVAWIGAFPPEPSRDWVDIAMEASYFLGAFAAWVIIGTWRERILATGWSLFAASLLVEVLDEFTVEPQAWNEHVPFALGAVGLVLAGAGFWRHTLRHERELSERDRATSSLERSLSTLQAVIEGTPDLVTVRDVEGRYLVVNSAAACAAGRPVAAMLGRTRADLEPGAAALSENDLRVLETGESVTYEETVADDGGSRTWLVTKAVYRDGRGFALGILRVARDISQRKLAEAQLAHDAAHDPLTGLPNRARMVEELGAAISRAKRNPHHLFAVLFVDLDRFKVINDSLGHTAGDQLLAAFARTLRGWLRPHDLVTRMGGDEFVVLLDGIERVEHATVVAGRIQEGLHTALKVGGREIFVAASIGVALSTTGYANPDEVLRDADLALYRAKAAGRGRYALFDAELHERAMAHLQLETDLRRALERNEFRLAYQPIVSLTTQRLVGFEALLRWQHPTKGLVAPGEFLAVADDTGLMVPIGRWVLGEALGQLAAWERQLPDARTLTMSVNVSSRQLVHPLLLDDVRAALGAAGLAPARLRIEVTESVIMEHTEAAVERLQQLRALGVLLDMDDFGTGYSSLSNLQRFPLHSVKIDRSFVDRMRGGKQVEIVRAILTLGQNLGLDVVAEGVETGEQQQQLTAMGCPHAQGYHFSHPVFAEEAGALIAGAAAVAR